MSKEEQGLAVSGGAAAGSGPDGQTDVFETPSLPAEAQESLQVQLDELQDEHDRVKELYLRKLADFDNYRKRQEREMVEYRKVANANLVRELLPVVDNLERALATPGSAEAGLRQGVELVVKQFQDTLARFGVTEVNPQGLSFDPSQHEAIQRVESSQVTTNTVIQVLQKGYLLGDKLLRPALVVVAVPAVAPSATRPLEEEDGQDNRS
jgi:molecular chaperone GrpE